MKSTAVAAKVLDDPSHPALRGEWDSPEVFRINYFREERQTWLAFEVYLTMRCPLGCEHCIANALPGRRESISPALLTRFLDELAELGRTRYVCLFGGEPLAVPKLLRLAIDRVNHHGMVPSVVTSGYWAKTAEGARRGAALLDGADRVQISTDRPHMKFLSIATTLRAVEAVLERGLRATVCYAANPGEFADDGMLPTELVQGCCSLGVGLVVTPLTDGGRAAGREDLVVPLSPDVPCAKLDVPLIGCDGAVYACGPGWTIPCESESFFRLGRYPRVPLAELLRRREESPLLSTLSRRGPLHALQRAARSSPGLARELDAHPPTSPCGACHCLAEHLLAKRSAP